MIKKIVALFAVFALAMLVACAPKAPEAAPPAPEQLPEALPEPVAQPAPEPVPAPPAETAAPAPETEPEAPATGVVVKTDQLGDAGATCETAGGDSGTASEKDKCCTDALKVPAIFQAGKCLPMS